MAQGIEAGALVVSTNLRAEATTELFDLLMEMMMLVDREHGLAREVPTINVLAPSQAVIRRQGEFQRLAKQRRDGQPLIVDGERREDQIVFAIGQACFEITGSILANGKLECAVARW